MIPLPRYIFTCRLQLFLPFCSILFTFATLAGSAPAINLKTVAHDSPPKFMLQDGTMTGVCVDIIKAIEQAAPDIRFTGYGQFIPPKRFQEMLKKGEIDAMVGMKKDIGREKFYTYVDVPIYQVRQVVVTRTANPRIEERADLNITPGSILSIFGSRSADDAKRIFGAENVDDGTKTPAAMLKKLKTGSGHYAFYQDMALKYEIRHDGLQRDLTVQPLVFEEYGHYIALSKKTPKDVADRLTAILNQLKENGTLDNIYKKYTE